MTKLVKTCQKGSKRYWIKKQIETRSLNHQSKCAVKLFHFGFKVFS